MPAKKREKSGPELTSFAIHVEGRTRNRSAVEGLAHAIAEKAGDATEVHFTIDGKTERIVDTFAARRAADHTKVALDTLDYLVNTEEDDDAFDAAIAGAVESAKALGIKVPDEKKHRAMRTAARG